MDEWAKHAEAEQKIVKAAAIVEAKQDVQLPELPAHLKRCLSQTKQSKKAPAKQAAKGKASKAAEKVKQAPKGEAVNPAEVKEAQAQSPSADKLVLKQLEDRKRREACADAVIKWFNEQKAKQPKVAVKQ